MNRLSIVDEIFLRSHRGMGTPIAMQGLWRTDDPIEPAALAEAHAALATGPLGRRVARSGLRRTWVRDTSAYPLDYSQEPVDDILAWADAQTPNLDPQYGPGWQLSATRLTHGGTLVSLVCSHVLTDARGLILAVANRTAPSAPVRESHPMQDKNHARGVTSAIAQVDAVAFDEAAGSAGPNALFVKLVTAIHGAEATVSLPVDGRKSDDDIRNSITMCEARIGPDDDLAAIRAKCRAAYDHPMGAPRWFPVDVLHYLPDRLVHQATKGAGERDVLCSNIGTLPDAIGFVGRHRATGVAARAIHPGVTEAPRLSGYLCRVGADYTLALVGDADLRQLADAQLARWGLVGRFW